MKFKGIGAITNAHNRGMISETPVDCTNSEIDEKNVLVSKRLDAVNRFKMFTDNEQLTEFYKDIGLSYDKDKMDEYISETDRLKNEILSELTSKYIGKYFVCNFCDGRMYVIKIAGIREKDGWWYGSYFGALEFLVSGFMFSSGEIRKFDYNDVGYSRLMLIMSNSKRINEQEYDTLCEIVRKSVSNIESEFLCVDTLKDFK